jgi:hypothetical protein
MGVVGLAGACLVEAFVVLDLLDWALGSGDAVKVVTGDTVGFVFDRVLRAGAVPATALYLSSPILWPSGTAINTSASSFTSNLFVSSWTS